MGRVLRYAMAPLGASLPEDLFWAAEMNVTNLAARGISVLPGSERVGGLHSIAGVTTYRKMYVKQCAVFLDGNLRRHKSSILARLTEELKAHYEGSILEPITMALELSHRDHLSAGLGANAHGHLVAREIVCKLVRRYARQRNSC